MDVKGSVVVRIKVGTHPAQEYWCYRKRKDPVSGEHVVARRWRGTSAKSRYERDERIYLNSWNAELQIYFGSRM